MSYLVEMEAKDFKEDLSNSLEIVSLTGVTTTTRKQGIVIDFRSVGEHVMVQDVRGKYLKPNATYKITIERTKDVD